MAELFDWQTIRAEWEVGASFRSLAEKHGVSHTSVRRHCLREGWQRDSEGTIRRSTSAKIIGIHGGVPVGGSTKYRQKKAQAIDIESTRRAKIVLKHRQEWELHRKAYDPGLFHGDIDAAKTALVAARTLSERQSGERKSFRLDDSTAETGTVTIHITREGADA